jgi:cytochrome P450
MSGASAIFDTVPRPDHVSADLVVDFDYLNPAGIECGDVYAVFKQLQQQVPDIFWTPRNGGHWVVTRAEDIRWVQENYQIFSHEVFNIPRGIMPVIMPPLTVDPPMHARYRAVLNPFFTASKVQQSAEAARALTIEVIEGLRPRGGCEFVDDFSRIMPTSIFLGIAGMPLDRREEFVGWAKGFMHAGSDQDTRNAYLGKIVGYLQETIADRTANPGEDLISKIVGFRQNPRFQGEQEIVGMAVLMFFGGLDTVASMLSFIAWHLATHPEHRRRIIEDPAIIPRAVEEYLRRHGLSNTGRLILSDVERKGAHMKADEMIMVPIAMSSLDERKHPNPFEVDFDREELFDAKGVPAHNTFGNGPHKCIGAPLARQEIRVFLEEWLRLIPDFRLDPERPPTSHAGSVNGVNDLHLVWDV